MKGRAKIRAIRDSLKDCLEMIPARIITMLNISLDNVEHLLKNNVLIEVGVLSLDQRWVKIGHGCYRNNR